MCVNYRGALMRERGTHTSQPLPFYISDTSTIITTTTTRRRQKSIVLYIARHTTPITMLLKIEVFPAGEPLRYSSSSSSSGTSNRNSTLDVTSQQQQLSIESSHPPLYVCLATSGKPVSKFDNDNDDNDNDIASDYMDPDAGRLLTVGRSKVTSTTASSNTDSKNDKPMVLIPASDKSVSREHCLLRLVCSSKQSDNFEYHPRPMPSRNELEEEACCCTAAAENNSDSNNLCIVVESMGKLGTYLVVEPHPTLGDDTPSKKTAKTKNDNSEDDETDEEDTIIGSALPISQQQQQQQSQSQASVMLLPTLSDATKQIIGSNKIAETTLIPIENSLVLPELSNTTTGGGRVILQCGKMGSTIVISRVTFHFVQASSSSSSSSSSSRKKGTKTTLPADTAALWYKRLYMIGATEGQTVTWNNNNNDNNNTTTATPTTLVLTASYNATPKQLAAWSRGIPLVTHDFMQAMLQRTSPHMDTLPKFLDYLPRPDGNDFWNKIIADPKLWSGTIFLSTLLDASTSSSSSSKKSANTSNNNNNTNSDAEMLVSSAGATIVRLYEMSTEQLQDVTRRLETDTTYAQSCFGLQHASSSSSSSGGGRGVRRTKSSSKAAASADSVVAVAAAKLLQDYNIPLFSTRTLAKLLTEQQSLTTPEGRILGRNNTSALAAAAAAATEKILEETMDNAATDARKVVHEKDKNVEMQQQNDRADQQETPPIDTSSSSSKRRRQRDEKQEHVGNNNSASQQSEDSTSLLLEQCSKKQRHLSPVEEEEPAATSAAITSKNNKETILDTLEQQSQKSGRGDSRLDKNKRNAASSSSSSSSQEINQDKHDESNDKNNKEKSKSKINKEHNNNHDDHHPGNQRCSLAASTTKQGWLVAAPSKTSKRQAYLRSRSEIQEQFGYDDLGPVAETEVIKGLLRRTNSGQGQQEQQQRRLGTLTGPDFKRFWKNEIAGQETRPGGASSGRRHGRPHRPRFVMVMANKNKGDSMMQMEFHEERQALEEEQRKADQLFCDPGTTATGRRGRKA